MNLADDIAQIVRTAPLTGVDWDFLKRMDPTKMGSQIDYNFAKTMLEAYVMTTRAGVAPEVALGYVLKSQEDAVRYVIDKAVRKRMLDLGTSELQVATLQEKLKELNDGITKAEQSVKDVEKARIDQAAKQGIEQFISYLLYAADKFAKGKEKIVITGVADRIRKEHYKTPLQLSV